ncbi:hypothetical protein EON80_32315 [bacterium]|nr:MAG: hypothetical protein EON80_32315 [bacterium]
MESRLDQKLDHAPTKRATTLPSQRELLAFDLLNAGGTLFKPPRPIRCPGCAQRSGFDGPVLCVLFCDTNGNPVLCYYHSKGHKNGESSGRFFLVAVAKGSKARVVCEHGHGCDIGL